MCKARGGRREVPESGRHRSIGEPFVNIKTAFVLSVIIVLFCACRTSAPVFELTYDTPADPSLQRQLEQVDANARAKFGIPPELTDVGLFDLRDHRLAMIH